LDSIFDYNFKNRMQEGGYATNMIARLI